MAVLKRIKNGSGDGAGRSRYAVKKAVMVWTDIPSSLSLLPAETLLERKDELANEFNRHLKKHQGSYKTQHFVLSFGHHLSEDEILEVVERLRENIFYDPARLHLVAVHQEKHGTAFHIIESGNQEGRLRHLDRKSFFGLNRKIKEIMQPFMNRREKEVAYNFLNGVMTQDWKHQIEIKAPERSFKVKVRKILLEEVAPLVKQGRIREAKRILEKNGIEIKEYKAGEISPKNKKVLKRDRVYAFVGWNGKQVVITLDSKMKATCQELKKAIEECENGLERIGKEARQDRERTEELRDEIKALEREGNEIERGNTELRRKIDEIEWANRELREGVRVVAEGSEELEREISELENGIQRNFREIEIIERGDRETSELEQAIRRADSLIAKDRELEARNFERIRRELEQLYEAVEQEYGITREELEQEFERYEERHARSEKEVRQFEQRRDNRIDMDQFRNEFRSVGEEVKGRLGREAGVEDKRQARKGANIQDSRIFEITDGRLKQQDRQQGRGHRQKDNRDKQHVNSFELRSSNNISVNSDPNACKLGKSFLVNVEQGKENADIFLVTDLSFEVEVPGGPTILRVRGLTYGKENEVWEEIRRKINEQTEKHRLSSVVLSLENRLLSEILMRKFEENGVSVSVITARDKKIDIEKYVRERNRLLDIARTAQRRKRRDKGFEFSL